MYFVLLTCAYIKCHSFKCVSKLVNLHMMPIIPYPYLIGTNRYIQENKIAVRCYVNVTQYQVDFHVHTSSPILLILFL